MFKEERGRGKEMRVEKQKDSRKKRIFFLDFRDEKKKISMSIR